MVESKEAGVYGLVAGGDFEAEALCLPGIWEDCSEALQDVQNSLQSVKNTVCKEDNELHLRPGVEQVV